MTDRYDIRSDEMARALCGKKGAKSISDAHPIRGGQRIADTDEHAYEMSHDPRLAKL